MFWIQFPCPEVTQLPHCIPFTLECYCWKWSFKFVFVNVLVLNGRSNSLRHNVYLHISYKKEGNYFGFSDSGCHATTKEGKRKAKEDLIAPNYDLYLWLWNKYDLYDLFVYFSIDIEKCIRLIWTVKFCLLWNIVHKCYKSYLFRTMYSYMFKQITIQTIYGSTFPTNKKFKWNWSCNKFYII